MYNGEKSVVNDKIGGQQLGAIVLALNKRRALHFIVLSYCAS